MPRRSSPADRAFMAAVAELGCILCGRPAEVHHIREFRFSQARASDREVLPLCEHHHRTGGYGEAIHAGVDPWRERFGSELDLFKIVQARLRARGVA